MATFKKEGKTALICLIALIILIPAIAYAQNKATEEGAINAILTAKEDVQDMMDHGIHVQLVHDTLFEGEKELYGENYTQLLVEAEHINETEKRSQVKKIIQTLQESISKRNIDYNFIIEKAAQVREIKERAYDLKYQLTSLKLRMDSIEQVNLSAEYGMYKEAESLFSDGMYDAAEEKIKETFTEVSAREAEYTGIRLLYRASRDNIINYAEDNWKTLLVGGTITAIAGLIALWQGIIYSLKRRINLLELEREVITDLIKESQKEHFVEGDITTEEYKIRLEGYEERTIDIDKRLPALKERLQATQAGIPGRQSLRKLIGNASASLARITSQIHLKKKKAFYTPKSSMKELLTPIQAQKKPSITARANNALKKIRAKIADMKMRVTISKLAKTAKHEETQKSPIAKKPKASTWLSNLKPRLRIKLPWTNKKSRLRSMLNELRSKVEDIKIRARIKRLTRARTKQLPARMKMPLPRINLPKLRLPKVKLPKIRLPRVRLPTVHLPKFRLPKIHLPKLRLHGFKKKEQVYVAPTRPAPIVVKKRKPWSRLHMPSVHLPRFRLPRAHLPKITLPKFKKKQAYKNKPNVELPKLELTRFQKNRKPEGSIRNAMRSAMKIPSNAHNKANSMLRHSEKQITSSIIRTGKATSRLAKNAPITLTRLNKKATRTINKIKSRLRKLI